MSTKERVKPLPQGDYGIATSPGYALSDSSTGGESATPITKRR